MNAIPQILFIASAFDDNLMAIWWQSDGNLIFKNTFVKFYRSAVLRMSSDKT